MGSARGADVLLRVAVVADRIRPVVHEKGSARHALCQPAPRRVATGAGSNRANCALAKFSYARAESCPFLQLKAQDNWPALVTVLTQGIGKPSRTRTCNASVLTVGWWLKGLALACTHIAYIYFH